MDKNIPKNPILFGIYISKFHKKWMAISLTFVFTATAVSRLNVVVLKNLTDAIAASPLDINNVWLWATSYGVLFFLAENIWRGSGFSGMRWFMNFRFSAYQILYEYLTLHSKDYFNSRFAGSLANKINHAVDGTQHLFEKALWNFLPLVLGISWFIIFTSITDFRLGTIIATWSLIFFAINIYFATKLQPKSYKSASTLSTLKGRFVDSLSNISLVHEYAYITGEREYIKQFVKKERNAGLSLWMLSEWVLVVNGLMISVLMIVMVGTSVFLFQNGIVSAGVVLMVIAITLKLSDQLLFLGQDMKEAARLFGEAKEGLEEILSDHIIVDKPGAKALSLSEGEITIDSLDFAYDSIQVFRDFSLTIPSGQKVGFVGRSGSGKSTFVSLLLRHYDIQKGKIKIDGQNISDITLESLRQAIAFVPQDTSLFHRTIRENISYSNPEATEKEIKRAAKFAQADEFIEALPLGYETLVGERGVKLSGGQRQRIAIARAFLKDAPILILDEATSSLDSQSEQAIQISLEKLMKGRTVIAIAHRLSTLKEMDRIVVIQNGLVVEDGHPESLLKKEHGIFKNMWDHQVKGFIIDD